MATVKNFLKGLTQQQVDWNTRWNSRAYGAGEITLVASITMLIIGFIFVAGFFVGRM